MAGVYSVAQVNSYIKNMFAQDFLLRRLSVKGEVSNCKYHSSGHIYFTLKDGGGTLQAVMFAGQRRGLSFKLAEGQQVVVKGTVDVYERDGKYQLYASEIELSGRGDLYLRFEKLLKELEEMGVASLKLEGRMKRPEYVAVVTGIYARLLREDRAHGSCDPGYHEYLPQTESICPADPLPGSGSGRRRKGQHRKRNPDA